MKKDLKAEESKRTAVVSALTLADPCQEPPCSVLLSGEEHKALFGRLIVGYFVICSGICF